MIIKCDKCNTSFKLPDEKIKPEGTKVRCSKCKNVFSVYPIKPATQPVAEEFEEKTRIGFIPAPFGEDKDDDSPVTIKRHQNSLSSSVESLGHGIPMSSPEIKIIEDSGQGLSEIMSAIESGLSKQVQTEPVVKTELPAKPADIPDIPLPDFEAVTSTPEKKSSPADIPGIDSLLDSISDINSSPPIQIPEKETTDSTPEELPDLSALLSATIQEKPAIQTGTDPKPTSGLVSPDKPKEPVISAQKDETAPPAPQIASPQDKLSMDIDKVFDSLFAESEPQTPPEQTTPQEKQVRKTMLYMEAVPVAHQNAQSISAHQQPPPLNIPPNPTEAFSLSDIPAPAKVPEPQQIQDNLLSDDLSMFLSPQNTAQPQIPKPPSLNMADDLLSELSAPPAANTPAPAPEPQISNISDNLGSFEFGELGADLPETKKPDDDRNRFSPNANRSDDLLSQMDSIDMSPVQSPVQNIPAIAKPAPVRSTTQEPAIQTYQEAGQSEEFPRKSTASVPLKPATMALKDSEKSIKREVAKWIFTLIFGALVGLISYSPSKIFPDINADILKAIRQPLITNSIVIENLYFRQISPKETLLIFTGHINLNKPVPPDSIILQFSLSDLSGNEIIQTEYPLTYTEKSEDIMNIKNMEEIRDFISKNRSRIITQRKNPFIAPLIISNIDINGVNVKSSVKVSSQ